jgi:hypothetical protein
VHRPERGERPVEDGHCQHQGSGSLWKIGDKYFKNIKIRENNIYKMILIAHKPNESEPRWGQSWEAG